MGMPWVPNSSATGPQSGIHVRTGEMPWECRKSDMGMSWYGHAGCGHALGMLRACDAYVMDVPLCGHGSTARVQWVTRMPQGCHEYATASTLMPSRHMLIKRESLRLTTPPLCVPLRVLSLRPCPLRRRVVVVNVPLVNVLFCAFLLRIHTPRPVRPRHTDA